MCSQYNPNPHELQLEGDFLELATMPIVRNTTNSVSMAQKQQVKAKMQQFLRSRQVRKLSPAERAVLTQRAQALLSRIR